MFKHCGWIVTTTFFAVFFLTMLDADAIATPTNGWRMKFGQVELPTHEVPTPGIAERMLRQTFKIKKLSQFQKKCNLQFVIARFQFTQTHLLVLRLSIFGSSKVMSQVRLPCCRNTHCVLYPNKTRKGRPKSTPRAD